VGSWSFDEGAGETAADASGLGNDGSLLGAPSWVAGVSGSALEFAGDGSRVLVADAASLDLAAGITLAAWIQPRSKGTQYVVKKARYGTTDGYELSLSSSGVVFVRFNQASAGNSYRLNSVSAYPIDGATWLHVAATYDGQEIKLYLDGVLEGTLPAPGLVIAANGLPLSIGAQDDGVAPLQGTTDEVHIHSVALTEAEIQDLIVSNLSQDTDGDGMPDRWELSYGFDPSNPSDAHTDADGDGVSNLDEFLQGSNPGDDLLEFWDPNPLTSALTTATTGEKPQSKVWFFGSTWWAVFPDSSGTWIWRLDGNRWTAALQLSSNPDAQADYELVEAEGTVHVLLFDGIATQLASAEYVPGSPGTYQLWSQRPQLVSVPLSAEAETATIALDSAARMWIAYDTSSTAEVRYGDVSDSFTTWSAPVILASGLDADDIAAVVAFDGQIGVFWSNQRVQRFGFRVHLDVEPPTFWSADEVPASQSALDVGGGMADDHLNFAVASDGTVYAAIKTSYDTSNLPKIALLMRRPDGGWDDLYEVDTHGTRPIVAFNEALYSLMVIYTESETGGDIKYRVSAGDPVSFGPSMTLMTGAILNNPSSTKEAFADDLLVIASATGTDTVLRTVLFTPD
jgi:hypothetical protein